MHRRFNSALFSLSSSSNYELKFSMWETFVEVPVSNKTVKCQGNYIYSLSQPTPPFFPPPHSGELDSSNGGAERVERTRPHMTMSTLSLSWELASSSTIAPIADHAHVRCEHGCSLRAALTSAPREDCWMKMRDRRCWCSGTVYVHDGRQTTQPVHPLQKINSATQRGRPTYYVGDEYLERLFAFNVTTRYWTYNHPQMSGL